MQLEIANQIDVPIKNRATTAPFIFATNSFKELFNQSGKTGKAICYEIVLPKWKKTGKEENGRWN